MPASVYARNTANHNHSSQVLSRPEQEFPKTNHPYLELYENFSNPEIQETVASCFQVYQTGAQIDTLMFIRAVEKLDALNLKSVFIFHLKSFLLLQLVEMNPTITIKTSQTYVEPSSCCSSGEVHVREIEVQDRTAMERVKKEREQRALEHLEKAFMLPKRDLTVEVDPLISSNIALSVAILYSERGNEGMTRAWLDNSLLDDKYNMPAKAANLMMNRPVFSTIVDVQTQTNLHNNITAIATANARASASASSR